MSQKYFGIVVTFGFFGFESQDQSSVGVWTHYVANIKRKIGCKTIKLHLLANARDDIVRACICFGFFLKVDFCF